MALTNTITALDKEKGMGYKTEVTHITLNLQLQANQSIIRDPGTDKEQILGTYNVAIPINLNGMINTEELLAEFAQANPDIIKLLPIALEMIAAKYSFPAPSKTASK